MTWKADAQQDFLYAGAIVRIGKRTESGFSVVTNLTMQDVADGEIEPDVALRGEDGVAFMQAVMDAAYEYGLRPSKAVDSAAMEAHLNDMRDISRHLLKMNKQ